MIGVVIEFKPNFEKMTQDGASRNFETLEEALGELHELTKKLGDNDWSVILIARDIPAEKLVVMQANLDEPT